MKWELVKHLDNGRQRVYRADEPILWFGRQVQELTATKIQELLEYKKEHYCGEKPFDFICDQRIVIVSDAKTHIERLVFLGCHSESDPEHISILSYSEISGRLTFMTYGGSWAHVFPDEIYLRAISIQNEKMKQQIKDKKDNPNAPD